MPKTVRLKMWFAEWLDKNPDYCWSKLVNWTFGYEDFWSLLWPWHSSHSNYKYQDCRESRESTPYAYCGKCEHNGRYYDVTKHIRQDAAI